jgi:LysR family transcriptional regulator, regulator for metE and metH
MYNINLQHLKMIQEIEKQGSMTKAAEVLYLSQSALSHQLRDLESKIDLPIFERHNKKLWLTEVGHQILSASEIITNELAKLDGKIDVIKKGDGGVIRISTECYTTYSWLPKLVVAFNKKHPNTHLKIVTEATANTLHYLQNGKLDVAITSRKKQVGSKLKYTSLFIDQLVVIVNKAHPLAKQKSFAPKDFENQALLVFDNEDKDIDLLEFVLKPNHIKPESIIKLPLSETIIEMVNANLGITVMANWLVAPLLSKQVVALPLKHAFAKRTWSLVSHDNKNQLQQKFIDFAVANLSNK